MSLPATALSATAGSARTNSWRAGNALKPIRVFVRISRSSPERPSTICGEFAASPGLSVITQGNDFDVLADVAGAVIVRV
jgi:hypothetical protein